MIIFYSIFSRFRGSEILRTPPQRLNRKVVSKRVNLYPSYQLKENSIALITHGALLLNLY
nr:MAG TPA: hypothetical protein [Caudoviricetes sp.]